MTVTEPFFLVSGQLQHRYFFNPRNPRAGPRRGRQLRYFDQIGDWSVSETHFYNLGHLHIDPGNEFVSGSGTED